MTRQSLPPPESLFEAATQTLSLPLKLRYAELPAVRFDSLQLKSAIDGGTYRYPGDRATELAAASVEPVEEIDRKQIAALTEAQQERFRNNTGRSAQTYRARGQGDAERRPFLLSVQ